MSSANLAEPLRTAIIGNVSITALLPAYLGGYPVFTRRPVPNDAPYPLIIISPDTNVTNDDGINDYRPISFRNINVYSANDTPEHYRQADTLAYLIRNLLHRNRQAIVVTGWNVVDIQVEGPQPSPSDDQSEGRILIVSTRLSKLRA